MIGIAAFSIGAVYAGFVLATLIAFRWRTRRADRLIDKTLR